MSMQNARYGANSRLSKRGRKQNGTPRRRSANVLYKNVASYPRQPLASFKVMADSVVASTTVTTGVISLVFDCDPVTNVIDWSTRFELFEEYRVIQCRAIVHCFASTNPGTIIMYWDETSATAPTATAAQERGINLFSAGGNNKSHTITWMPVDLTDLRYFNTSTTNVPVRLKIYTDNANYGSSTVATQYISVTLEYTIQLRGFSTV